MPLTSVVFVGERAYGAQWSEQGSNQWNIFSESNYLLPDAGPLLFLDHRLVRLSHVDSLIAKPVSACTVCLALVQIFCGWSARLVQTWHVFSAWGNSWSCVRTEAFCEMDTVAQDLLPNYSTTNAKVSMLAERASEMQTGRRQKEAERVALGALSCSTLSVSYGVFILFDTLPT